MPRQRLRKPARSPEHDYPQLTKLYLENEKAPAYLDFDTDYHLYDSQNRAHAWANSDGATVHWFGTAMGGLIGMLLASLAQSPIRKLVLNDIGPVLDPAAMARIGQYIGEDLRFPSFEAGAAYVRAVSASFGPHTEAQWHKLAADVLRQADDGSWVRHYDLGLAKPFAAITPEAAKEGEAALWAAFDAIRCPTLLVRGALSDLLSADTAAQMAARGPRPDVVEIPGVGHAPTFMNDEQIAIARRFLIG